MCRPLRGLTATGHAFSHGLTAVAIGISPSARAGASPETPHTSSASAPAKALAPNAATTYHTCSQIGPLDCAGPICRGRQGVAIPAVKGDGHPRAGRASRADTMEGHALSWPPNRGPADRSDHRTLSRGWSADLIAFYRISKSRKTGPKPKPPQSRHAVAPYGTTAKDKTRHRWCVPGSTPRNGETRARKRADRAPNEGNTCLRRDTDIRCISWRDKAEDGPLRRGGFCHQTGGTRLPSTLVFGTRAVTRPVRASLSLGGNSCLTTTLPPFENTSTQSPGS